MLVYQLCFLLLFGKALIREDQEFGGSQVPGKEINLNNTSTSLL